MEISVEEEEEEEEEEFYPDQRVQWLELLGPRRSAGTEADLSPYNTEQIHKAGNQRD